MAPSDQRDLDLILDRLDALKALAFATAPMSLADVAALISLATAELNFLADFDLDAAERVGRQRAVSRALALALPIVAGAAAVNVGDIYDDRHTDAGIEIPPAAAGVSAIQATV